MRVAKRICAFALALTIAFLSVGYEPPKANAVVTEVVGTSALATSALASYMTATGVPLSVISGGAAAASAGTASLISGYAAATGGTVEVITTSIAAGATIGTGGVIILSVAAVAALAAITAWVIDEYGLIGEDGEPVAEPVAVAPGVDTDLISYNGKVAPGVESVWVDKIAYPYAALRYDDNGLIVYLYLSSVSYLYDGTRNTYTPQKADLLMYSWHPDNSPAWTLLYNGNTDVKFPNTFWTSHDILTTSGSVYLAASEPVTSEDWENPSLAASLEPGYAPKPELAPDTQVVLNPNLAPEFYPDAEPAPEALSEAIFEKLANGDFTPQYTEEPVADPDTGGGDNPDDGTEDEPSTGVDLSGVLGWLEAIWNAIKSLVEAIGDKLMQLFVPSEEYMEALSEALMDAFAERTGFLTYPMSLLFGFVDLIATPAGDFILEWDDVYEPFSRGKLISAGQFNVTQYVNSNQALSNVYSLWKTVVSGYLIFMFFDLCYKKYNAIVRDRLG